MEKVMAIHNVPDPAKKKDLQAYMGRLNFYRTFLKNKATEPFHFIMTKLIMAHHNQAFRKSKLL